MSPGGCGPGSNSGGDPWSNGGGGTWPGGGSGNYGDACWSSSECSSNLCVQSSCSGALFCTKACNSDADCGGTACVGTNVAGLYVCSEGGGTAPPPQNPAPTPPPAPAPPQGDVTPPRVLILSPSNKTVVAPQLSLEANATDDVAVTQVDLYIDGVLAATSSAAPYSFPVQLSRGTHVLKVIARDAAGNQGTAQTMVGVTQDPTPAAPSPAAPTPTAPPLLGYGAVCGGPADCQSGLCAHDGASNRRFCTQACNAAALCPTGSGCFSVAAGPSICAPTSGPLEGPAPTRPTAEDSVGFAGCSVGPNAKASPFMLTTLMLLGLAVLLRRRR